MSEQRTSWSQHARNLCEGLAYVIVALAVLLLVDAVIGLSRADGAIAERVVMEATDTVTYPRTPDDLYTVSIEDASGVKSQADAIWYVPMRFEYTHWGDGRKQVSPVADGQGRWQLRWRPGRPGTYWIGPPFNASVSVNESTSRGFIRRDGWRLVYEDGSPYVPVGFQQSWAAPSVWKFRDFSWGLGYDPPRGYEEFFRQNPGMTHTRVWLTDIGDGIRPGVQRAYGANLTRMDACIVDAIVALAESHGVYLQVVLGRYRDNQSDADLRKFMRQVVAWWGASEHVFMWELWNEQARADEPERIRRAARMLREVDPYQHLITASQWEDAHVHPPIAQTYLEGTLDVVTPHKYLRDDASSDWTWGMWHVQDFTRQRIPGVPLVWGELGMDAAGSKAQSPFWIGTGLPDEQTGVLLGLDAAEALRVSTTPVQYDRQAARYVSWPGSWDETGEMALEAMLVQLYSNDPPSACGLWWWNARWFPRVREIGDLVASLPGLFFESPGYNARFRDSSGEWNRDDTPIAVLTRNAEVFGRVAPDRSEAWVVVFPYRNTASRRVIRGEVRQPVDVEISVDGIGSEVVHGVEHYRMIHLMAAQPTATPTTVVTPSPTMEPTLAPSPRPSPTEVETPAPHLTPTPLVVEWLTIDGRRIRMEVQE